MFFWRLESIYGWLKWLITPSRLHSVAQPGHNNWTFHI